MTALVCRLIVWLAARIVPGPARARFIREWQAEFYHEGRRLTILTSLHHAAGAFPDARALRRLAPTGTARNRSARASIVGWATDLRRAVRGLRRSPGFALATVATLALGLGGAAAIYTLLDAVVLDPLPFPHHERLVHISNQVPGVGPDEVWGTSTAQQVYYAEHASTLELVGSYRAFGANMLTPAGPERVFGWRVTASLFPLMGARPLLGRLIHAADDRPGSPPVVVLSHALWQRQFGSDPEIIGQAIRIDDNSIEVIGVLARGVEAPLGGGAPGDLWMPLGINPDGFFGNNHVYNMVGRVGAGVTRADAEAELERLERELPARFPDAYSQGFFDGSGFRTQLVPLKEAVVGEMARNLWILFGAVGIVLLIACANVANLFAVRTESRGRDLAIRSALGASRFDLGRYVVAEALVLSMSGAVLALIVVRIGGPAFLSMAPGAVPRVESVTADAGTVAVTLFSALLVGLALGGYALARHQGGDISALAGGRATGASRARQRVRSLLVVSQVALALTLVVGASLLVQSLTRLNAIDPGFDADGVLTVRLYLNDSGYADDVAIWGAYDRILAEVRAIRGVVTAGMAEELPVEGRFGCTVQGFADQGVYEHLRRTGQNTCAGQDRIAPGYFDAMGIPVLRGRALTDADNHDPTRAAVVVSETFARRFWPDQDPIGRGVAPSGRTTPPFYRVVGVVGDVPARALDGAPANAIYYPIVHNPDTPGNWGWWRPQIMTLVVKTELSEPAGILSQVRQAVDAVDPTIPLVRARTMNQVLGESTARFAFVSVLLGIAASIALSLAAVGLYGVVAYVVSRSTREIGLRVAIGARVLDVRRMFVTRSLKLIGVGIIAGVGAGLAATRLLQGLLYGVAATDPATFVTAAGVLAVVGLVASWIPARRATLVDPVEALRGD